MADRNIRPSAAALAFVSRLTEADWKDVYSLACKIDDVAEEARTNERNRILTMGFGGIMREFWKGKKLYVKP
jgi:hypothetical protein